MEKEYLPIIVNTDDGTSMWQMDITNASYSELIELRNLFKGVRSDVSIRIIDGIISKTVNKKNTYFRRCKKENKQARLKKRRRIKAYK